MGLFIKDGKVKSPLMIISFSLSLLFVVVFVLAYLFTAGPVAQWAGQETGSFWEIWLIPSAVATIASGICCLFMIPFQDKRTVPVAFLFFAAYFVLLNIVLYYNVDEANLPVARQILFIYMLPPTVFGNLMSWGIYWLIRQKNRLNPS